LGVEPERILYANPCKRNEDIVFARVCGVSTTTFDSECELRKMSTFYPECKLILRIRADDPKARCPLGNKYGVEERDWDVLLFTARSLGLDIVGISFHVGSYASSPKVFSLALAKAKKALRLAKQHGFKPKIVDIGGGFSETAGLPSIKPIRGLNMIAEPGRFFVERTMTLYTPVIGTKGSGITIAESLYGGFSCIGMDHASPRVSKVLDEFGNKIDGEPVQITIFGNSCDGSDIIYKEYEVPHGTGYGSILIWENMGAYTVASATNFNGLGYNSRKILVID
jgi:ornithine decarboxylase